jgi:hypothetical protein
MTTLNYDKNSHSVTDIETGSRAIIPLASVFEHGLIRLASDFFYIDNSGALSINAHKLIVAAAGSGVVVNYL